MMPTATQLRAELEQAGVPTHRPSIQQLCARRAIEQHGYDLKAYIRAMPMPERVEFIRSQIDVLGGHPLAALFDLVSRDLRKLFEDDTADIAVDLADAIRADLRSEDIRVHGGVR